MNYHDFRMFVGVLTFEGYDMNYQEFWLLIDQAGTAIGMPAE